MIFRVRISYIRHCDIPGRFFTSSFFGLWLFWVPRFSIYSAIWIRPTGQVHHLDINNFLSHSYYAQVPNMYLVPNRRHGETRAKLPWFEPKALWFEPCTPPVLSDSATRSGFGFFEISFEQKIYGDFIHLLITLKIFQKQVLNYFKPLSKYCHFFFIN